MTLDQQYRFDTLLVNEVLEQTIQDISRQYTKALNDWLEWCVEKWCPSAHALGKAGLYQLAHDELTKADFNWSQESIGWDTVVTFWQGETPLAKCRIDISLHRCQT